MSDSDDALLELFVSLPQLKQVNQDKEELVTNIVEMASKFLPPASEDDGEFLQQEKLTILELCLFSFLP